MKDSIAKHLPDLPTSSTRKRMSLPLGLPHPSRRNSAQQEEVREAKKFLRDHVKVDWDYPPLPRFQIPVRTKKEGAVASDKSPDEAAEGKLHTEQQEGEEEGDDNVTAVDGDEGGDKIAGFRFYQQSSHARDTLLHRAPEQLEFAPLEWREREISSEETPEPDDDDDETQENGTNPEGIKKERKIVYKFDNPDSIGDELQERKLARKRKRQKRLDEECKWNDGMAHWLARRDAWCGAHTSSQVHAMDSGKDERSNSITASISTAASASTRSSTDSSETTDAASTTTPSTTPDLPSETASSDQPPIIPTEPPAPPNDILVPLAPPILVHHPVRRRIGVDVYPEIYSKIILQSRTPSVPINLVDMTRALVQGWKDDGEWPPKPLAMSSRERKYRGPETVLKNGVKAVGRALRLGGGDSAFVVQSSRS